MRRVVFSSLLRTRKLKWSMWKASKYYVRLPDLVALGTCDGDPCRSRGVERGLPDDLGGKYKEEVGAI